MNKVKVSFTESEIEMFNYLMSKIMDNIRYDHQDQVYRDNGDILIQFGSDRIKDVKGLLNKFETVNQ